MNEKRYETLGIKNNAHTHTHIIYQLMTRFYAVVNVYYCYHHYCALSRSLIDYYVNIFTIDIAIVVRALDYHCWLAGYCCVMHY